MHKFTQKTKNECFRNLDIKDLNNNKFWKRIKPFFSDKGLETNITILKKKNELITNGSTLANSLNNFLSTLQVL